MTDKWPVASLAPRDISVNIASASIGGGRTLSGIEQTISSDSGYWKVTYGNIPVLTREKRYLWNALQSFFEGRTNTLLIPIFPDVTVSIPFSDTSVFSDQTGFRQPTIDAVITTDASMGDVDVSITVNDGSPIEAGYYFSVGERLYRIRISDGGTIVGDTVVYAVEIRPTLREDISADDVVIFDNPACLMKLEKDDGMDAVFQYGRFGNPSVSFVEVLGE